MLTVDFDRLGLRPGDRVLDMGCGAGRHAFEMYRRGADVIAFDQDADELAGVRDLFGAMREAGEVPAGAEADIKQGDALSLPFADGEFDRVVASEVLEHIPDDIQRHRRAGPGAAPRRHDGGHRAALAAREGLLGAVRRLPRGRGRPRPDLHRQASWSASSRAPGWSYDGKDHAHGLHSPYWWIKCAVGVNNDDHPLVKAYHRLLVWDIMKRPLATRLAERVLNPLIGKSMVLYFRKPDAA